MKKLVSLLIVLLALTTMSMAQASHHPVKHKRHHVVHHKRHVVHHHHAVHHR